MGIRLVKTYSQNLGQGKKDMHFYIFKPQRPHLLCWTGGGHPGVEWTWNLVLLNWDSQTQICFNGEVQFTQRNIEEAVGRTVVGGKKQLCINMRVGEGPYLRTSVSPGPITECLGTIH